MKWDLFICHASEDKESFVRPLVLALKKRQEGLRIWYDEFTLKIGDRLRERIDFGLSNSRFGVVVLSPGFFDKEWPQKELDGLIALESRFRKIVLPIWHNIDRRDIVKFSPILADRLAVRSSDGMEKVVESIILVLQDAGAPALRKVPYKVAWKKLLIGLCSLLLILSILAVLYTHRNIENSPLPSEGVRSDSTVKTISSRDDEMLPVQQSIYLPMAKGNKWVYRKTVPEGVKVLCWESWDIEGKLHYAHAPLDRIKPGITEEVFTVGDELDEDGRKRWTIQVSNPENARDGRYRGIIRKPEKIMWGRLISSAHVLEFGEILTAENPFEGQLRAQRTLFPQPLLPNAEVRTQSMGVSAVTYECTPTAKTISVPAGKFLDCLEAITTVSAKDAEKRWATYSYYAPHVGLVKEFQRNPDKRTTYTLELSEYKIQGPR